MADFTKTPSYFNNNETFEKYLGQTSYYLALQDAVEKIIRITKPSKVLELGSATGATTIKLAKLFKNIKFVGVDMRSDVTAIAVKEAEENKASNAGFMTGDMCETVKAEMDDDLVYLLYSYHHITDPVEKKITFARRIQEYEKQLLSVHSRNLHTRNGNRLVRQRRNSEPLESQKRRRRGIYVLESAVFIG